MTPLRWAAFVLGAVQGAWMLVDGAHVMLTGTYLTGETGPWVAIPRSFGVDEATLGPTFLLIGSLWLIGILLMYGDSYIGARLMTLAAIVSLLYFPVGTFFSLVVLVLLFMEARKAGTL